MKLLGRRSSINVRKVLWTCGEIGLDFAHEPWGADGLSLADPAFRRLNPLGLVPVWVDGDFVLRESNTICRHLARAYGRDDLLPPDGPARAVVEQWMDWQATELNTAWRYAFLGLVRRSPTHQDAAQIQASLQAWAQQLALLETQLERTRAHVTGPGFTLADIGLGLSVQRWFGTPADKPPRPDFPALAAYLTRLQARPAFQAQRLGEDA